MTAARSRFATPRRPDGRALALARPGASAASCPRAPSTACVRLPTASVLPGGLDSFTVCASPDPVCRARRLPPSFRGDATGTVTTRHQLRGGAAPRMRLQREPPDSSCAAARDHGALTVRLGRGWQVAAGAVAKQSVAEAEETLATGLRQKAVATLSSSCGEPHLNKQPNDSHGICGEPNIRRGDVWRATKHPHNHTLQ